MSNRAAKFEQLHKSLKKHYKVVEEATERTVLEHLLYACCLEDARVEQADEAFAKLQQTYFDWNEVRVTTVIELGEILGNLPNPQAAGHRIKRCLQSLFESRYQYDIEDMKKANLSKALEDLQAWKGVSSFILLYVSQQALGGHSIPADTSTLDALVAAEIITQSEAEKKTIPGIERAIAKNKGYEFSGLLHQFAVDFAVNPKSPSALAVFKDLGVTPKQKVAPEPAASKSKKSAAEKPIEKELSKAKEAPAPKESKPLPSAPAAKGDHKPSGEKPKSPPLTVKPVAKSTDSKHADSKDAKVSPKKESKADESKSDSKKGETPKAAPKNVSAKGIEKAKPAPAKGSAKGTVKPNKPEAAKPKTPAKSEKLTAKKPATPAAKKPTKMANNVKITKKKPK